MKKTSSVLFIIACLLFMMCGCSADNTENIKETNAWVIVSAGDSHSLALDEDGNVYSWGYNYSGQLGQDTISAKESKKKVTIPEKIIKIAAGDYFSLALAESGAIYSCGSNGAGELGYATTSNTKSTFTKIESDTQFVEISAGDQHVLAIDSSGAIWVWGDGRNGQLGTGQSGGDVFNGYKINVPTKLDLDVAFQKVVAGQQFSLAIDVSGNIWGWGINEDGQVGNGQKGNSQYTNPIKVLLPTKITSDIKFASIAAGKTHSIALDELGNIWSWGNNYDGQLGNGTNDYCLIPQILITEEKFVTITVGDYHNAAIDTNGSMWTWGFNAHGRLGNGTNVESNELVKIEELKKFIAVECGATFTVFVADDNKIYACGNNDYTQLGNNANKTEYSLICPFDK